MSALSVTIVGLAIIFIFSFTEFIMRTCVMGVRRRRAIGRSRKPDLKQMDSNTSLKIETPLSNLLDDLGQDISIDDELNEETFAKCNPQDQSSLFTTLPREVRDLIYEFASAQYNNPEHTYEDNKFYYRPGHIARQKTDCSFLLTCRRVWLEANAHPMLQAEHCFWKYRPAPDSRNKEWMAELTRNNRKNFGHLHLYVQMYAIENLTGVERGLSHFFLPNNLNIDEFGPRAFTVTVRHTDWWNWETEAPLRLKDKWVQALLNSPDLRSTQVFKLELETLDYKVVQLRPILERLQQLVSEELITHTVDGVPTTTRFALHDGLDFSEWSGPTRIEGRVYPQYASKTELRYHIYTLTWRLEFPQLGRVNVARLRRAPRIHSSTARATVADETPERTTRSMTDRITKQKRATATINKWREQGSLLRIVED